MKKEKRGKMVKEERERSILESLLTSRVRVKLLSYLFFNKQSVFIRQLSNTFKISPSIVKREMENLLLVGIVKKENNLFSLDKSCIFLDDLKSIFIKTDYLAGSLKKTIISDKIQVAFIFGSFAKGNFTNESDIDLLVIGTLSQKELFESVKFAEKETSRTINPILFEPKNFKKNIETGFIKDILNNKKIFLKGDEDELQKIIG
jgi:predicted nucleotidyltransferase